MKRLFMLLPVLILSCNILDTASTDKTVEFEDSATANICGQMTVAGDFKGSFNFRDGMAVDNNGDNFGIQIIDDNKETFAHLSFQVYYSLSDTTFYTVNNRSEFNIIFRKESTKYSAIFISEDGFSVITSRDSLSVSGFFDCMIKPDNPKADILIAHVKGNFTAPIFYGD